MERSSVAAPKEDDVTSAAEESFQFDDDSLRAIAEVYKNEGNDACNKRNYNSAIHFYTEGIKVNCKDEELNAKLYNNRAVAHFNLGNYSESVNDATIATELQPSYLKAFLRGAMACIKLKKFDEASAWCDKGLAIDPNNRDFLELQCLVVVEQMKLQEDHRNKSTASNLPVTAVGIGSRSTMANFWDSSVGNLGNIHHSLGDFKTAIDYHERCLKIAKELDDRSGDGNAYCSRGNAHLSLGDFKTAKYYCELNVRIAKELGDRSVEGKAYGSLGNAHFSLRDFKTAKDCCERHLKIAKELGDRLAEGEAYGNLGNIHHSLGDFKTAIDYHERCLKVAKELGDRSGEGRAYGILGIAHQNLGDLRTAISYHELCLKIAKELSDRSGEKEAYRILGKIHHSLGDLKSALGYYELCLKIAKELGNRSGEGAAYGIDHHSLGDVKTAKTATDYHERHLKVEKELDERSGEGATHDNLGDTVPSEIKARGPRAKLAYENALKTGTVKVHRARIMLIGQERAGKTSLKKSFLGLAFDPEEESTEGIEVDPSKLEVDVEQVKNWERTDEKKEVSQFASDLAKMVARELLQEENEEGGKTNLVQLKQTNLQGQVSFDAPGELHEQKTSVEPSIPPNQGISGKAKEETNTAFPTGMKTDLSLPPEEFTNHLVELLKSLNPHVDATVVEHHMTLDLWDFAGQHLYYASYPIFFSPRAVYVLVYDLNKRLKDTAQPCFKQGIREILLSNPNKETNLENLLSWLVSLNAMCSLKPEVNDGKNKVDDLPYRRPPVFIVGTHADKPHDDIVKIESQIQQEISGKDYADHVIRPFFSVDNTQGSNDEGVAALQKRMIEVLKQEPYMGEEVPARWFNFERVVQILVSKGVYHLHLQELQTIIRDVCFIENEEEVSTMLDFYHDLGVIVRHRNTVVLQAQWLIEVLKQLITIRSFNDMEPAHSKLWKEMETTGALKMELVDFVFSKFCKQNRIKEDILNMMEQFGLIVNFATSPGDELYFVPCQLKTPPACFCQVEPSPSDPCPLYLHFQGGFVPHGLFNQLVSQCTRWCSKSGYHQKPHFFDRASRFFIEEEPFHQLLILCKKRAIKIILMATEEDRLEENTASFLQRNEVAVHVRMFLEEAMETLKSERPWCRNLAYDMCVACPNCRQEREKLCSNHDQVSCTHEDCLCLLKVLKGGKTSYCQNSLGMPSLPELKRWFSSKVIRPGHHPGTDDVYKMTARPRGIALTINNKWFPDPEKQLPRHGSEEDVRKIETLFTALGFTVRTEQDLSRLQLLNVLDGVACDDHGSYDCFVLWLMSHGKSGEVFCSDEKTVPIQTLHDLFSQCDTLRGKPKLFFIQACRGSEEDEGVSVAADTGISSCKQRSQSQIDSPFDSVERQASRQPTHADFLYAFSSVDDYVSYRHEGLGSYYVRCLYDVFRERAVYDHLLDILTNVNQKVSNMEAMRPSAANKNEIKILKQMPEVRHTLRKKVRF